MKPPSSSNRLINDDADDASRSTRSRFDDVTSRSERPSRLADQPQSEIASEVRPHPAETIRRPSMSGAMGRGPYPGRKQVTAHVDKKLFLWLKSISAQEDKPMVLIFEEALSAYVNTYAAQKKFGS